MGTSSNQYTSILQNLESCNFECEAGPLSKNLEFCQLKEMLQNDSAELARMGTVELAQKVQEMRELQKRFFKGDRSVVGQAKKIEAEVDKMVAGYLGTPSPGSKISGTSQISFFGNEQ